MDGHVPPYDAQSGGCYEVECGASNVNAAGPHVTLRTDKSQSFAGDSPVVPPRSTVARPRSGVNDNSTVGDVKELLVEHVCRGLPGDKRNKIGMVLRAGAERFCLSGFALLAVQPPPERLAASLLEGREFPPAADKDGREDGVLWSTVSFVARSRPVAIGSDGGVAAPTHQKSTTWSKAT